VPNITIEQTLSHQQANLEILKAEIIKIKCFLIVVNFNEGEDPFNLSNGTSPSRTRGDLENCELPYVIFNILSDLLVKETAP